MIISLLKKLGGLFVKDPRVEQNFGSAVKDITKTIGVDYVDPDVYSVTIS